MPPHQAYQTDCYPKSYDDDHLHQSDSPSFQSIPSIPSVPSLTSQSHISRTCYHCVATLTGHTAYISSLTLAWKYLYTGSFDGEIRLWKRNPSEAELNYDKSQTNNNVIATGGGAVKSFVVLADKLFSAHQDHKIRVWKINSQDESDDSSKRYAHLATLPTLGDRMLKLLLPRNQVQIRRHKKATWVHHVDTVSALALAKDETLLYSVSWDRTLKIWRTADFKCLESITNAHDDAINAVALADDGDVYTGSADKKIKVWRKNTGEKKHSLVATLEKHKSGINALALSGDGSVLYSGACDRSILVWEKDDDGHMVVAGALRGHTKSILCLVVVSDLVCSGSADTTVRIWRGIEGNYCCLALLEGHKGPVKCLTGAIDNSGQCETSYLIYSGSLDCDIKVWQVCISPP